MNLKLENVSFIYDNNGNSPLILENISFEIKSGEFVGIVGPSGSGKTTLFELISGFLRPFSGRILFGGTDRNSRNKINLQNKVSMVFQFPEKQIFADSVFDDIAFGPKNHGISGEKLKELIKKSIELVGLEYDRVSTKSPFELSSGEQRRVAIAGILALETEVILLDEPTIAVDFNGMKCIEKIMNSINSTGKTVVLISHDMDLIVKNVNRIIALNKGKIVYNGNKKDFFNNDDLIYSLNLEIPEIIRFIRKHNLGNIDDLNNLEKIKNEFKKIKNSTI